MCTCGVCASWVCGPVGLCGQVGLNVDQWVCVLAGNVCGPEGLYASWECGLVGLTVDQWVCMC